MENKVKDPVAGQTPVMPKKIHGVKLNNVVPVQPSATQKAKQKKSSETFNKVRIVSVPAKTTEAQVFTASVNAFGKTNVAVDSIVTPEQNDVMLAFAKATFTLGQIFTDFICD